jgi:activator of HSP90 ATPase
MASKKKAPAKKASAKKAPAKKTSAKKIPAKKTSAKKTPAKKTSAKKTPTKKTAKKTAKTTTTTKTAKKAPSSTSTRTVVQHVFLPAPPSTIYRMLTDPVEHGAFTGTVCEGEPIETGSFTASSGYISGRYEILEPDRLIVCSWQTSEWPKDAPPSRLEFVLKPVEGGTELTMTHSELPASQAEDYRQGWIDFYWTPMREALKA